jgi:hypothetical protein
LLWLKESTPAMFPIMKSYKCDLVFIGDVKPHWLRQLLSNAMEKRMNKSSYVSYGWDWATICSQSKFVLCPSGFGRNSYRLGEVLLMGMVPVFVYIVIIWEFAGMGIRGCRAMGRVSRHNTTFCKDKDTGYTADAVADQRIVPNTLFAGGRLAADLCVSPGRIQRFPPALPTI